MLAATDTQHTVADIAREDRKEFRRLFGVAFVLFFLIAAVSRLLPRAWRPLAAASGRRESIYAEAVRAAYTAIPFAFTR
ncbi:MAG: hypothetical protein P8106_02605 [Gammaproteobacteria bacterium]|jgi:hypothetical protein